MGEKMRTVLVNDKAIVLVLKKSEAEALKKYLKSHNRGLEKTKQLRDVEIRLAVEMGET
jgi:hypothetical protein